MSGRVRHTCGMALTAGTDVMIIPWTMEWLKLDVGKSHRRVDLEPGVHTPPAFLGPTFNACWTEVHLGTNPDTYYPVCLLLGTAWAARNSTGQRWTWLHS
jgi:hypothetical protein